MKRRGVFWGCLMLLGAAGACTRPAPKVADKRPMLVAPAKPSGIDRIYPARFVLLDSVGVSYDETGEASPIHAPDLAIVAGKRLVLEGGRIIESATFSEQLVGFRSMPTRLGGGYVFWSDEHSYHAPTFLGKLTPFAAIGAKGGVRPWFDSFVLRTEIGSLEVTPQSFAVRRTELARFSEMLSFDGKIGVRKDLTGRMEASVDGGKTFRSLTFDEGKRYVGPSPGPSNTLTFYRDSSSDWSGKRPDRQVPEALVLAASGALIPFEPKANEPISLEPPSWSMSAEEPALTRRFAPFELGLAVVAGALVPGNQVVFLRESTLRVLSAKTGELIQDLPLPLGPQEFGHCQPVTLGDEAFLACTHASGAHLYALRETPTTVQLEATFPEPGGFVAGLGKRFLYLGRCGSTPPTVRDFPGYGLSSDTPDAGDVDPNAPPAPPEPPAAEDVPEKPANEAVVCVRREDGTWIERRIDGLKDRKNALFLPGDGGEVTVVVSDNGDSDKPATKAEGVRFIRVDKDLTKFGPSDFFEPYDSSEPKLRTIARDVWLDEKDGSVHGWEIQIPKDEVVENSEADEPSGGEKMGMIGLLTGGRIVGVQIKSNGSVEKFPLPDGVESVVVGGPYAFARAPTDTGPKYYESTDGGHSFTPTPGPIPGNFIEYSVGDVQGCSIVGCTLGDGLVRLGWGGDAPPVAAKNAGPDKPEDTDGLMSKVFDPHTLVPPKPNKELHCRLEAKENAAATNADKPFAVTIAMSSDVNVGTAVVHKWTAFATTPFDVKPSFQVLFEDVNVDSLKGEAIPLLRSTATNPVGLLLRTKEFRFDMSSGPKRKPVALSPDVRGTIAAEIDHETFVLFDPRLRDVQLVRGTAVRSLMQINQIPDVNYTSFTLARRAGAGDDVFALALVQTGSGDILLGDLDLGRGAVGPLRVAGNMRKLDAGASCTRGPRDYRLVVNEQIRVQLEPAEDEHKGLFGSSLVTIGSGNGCLEASEIRLGNDATVVVRYSGTDSGGHPAMLHDHGSSLRGTCTRE